MKRLLVILATATCLMAQRASEIVPVKYQQASVIHKLISPMFTSNTSSNFDDQLKVITLSGPPEVVEMLVNNIHRLDVAPSTKSVELTIQLLIGSETDGKVPDELAATVKQLKATFPFKGYRLFDTIVVRSMDGKGADSAGALSTEDLPKETPGSTYQMHFTKAEVEGEGATRSVSVIGFKFGTRYAYQSGVMQPGLAAPSFQWSYADAGLNADLSIREGQRVVIGKTVGNAKEPLFIVVSAKVSN
jgi:type II secretory pathway component GspD/PulD (secretin)